MVQQLLDSIIQKVRHFDSKIAEYITNFLKPYSFPSNPPYFTAHVPLYIKLVFYLSTILILLSFIKLFFIGNRKYTILLVILVVLIGLAIAGIFFGFMQGFVF